MPVMDFADMDTLMEWANAECRNQWHSLWRWYNARAISHGKKISEIVSHYSSRYPNIKVILTNDLVTAEHDAVDVELRGEVTPIVNRINAMIKAHHELSKSIESEVISVYAPKIRDIEQQIASLTTTRKDLLRSQQEQITMMQKTVRDEACSEICVVIGELKSVLEKFISDHTTDEYYDRVRSKAEKIVKQYPVKKS
jgi:hypothetical protein